MKEKVPYWLQLITYWVEIRHRNGLSIPFILGAKTLIDADFVIDEKSVADLLNQIRNSDSQKIITLQNCPDILEYVLGINNPLNPKVGLEIKNEKTDETKIIATLDTTVLGKNIEEITKTLARRYQNCLSEKKFSRIDFKWSTFSEDDLQTIKLALQGF